MRNLSYRSGNLSARAEEAKRLGVNDITVLPPKTGIMKSGEFVKTGNVNFRFRCAPLNLFYENGEYAEIGEMGNVFGIFLKFSHENGKFSKIRFEEMGN